MSSSILEMEDYSMDNLLNRLKAFQAQHKNDCRLVATVAGGGGTFMSGLASTPGASAILVEGTLTYDRQSYRNYVNKEIDMETFKFCSKEAAQLAAESALTKASRLCAFEVSKHDDFPFPLSNFPKCIGVGCASALLSDSKRKNRTSRAYVSVTSPLRQVNMRVGLAPDGGRSRFEQDIFVAHCILTCLEVALDPASESISYTTAASDEIEIEVPKPSAQQPSHIVEEAAQVVLSGTRRMLSLVPTVSGFSSSEVYLPPKSLVVPGSFNPPHIGHLELAKAAAREVGAKVIWFELSITNVDKPSLSVEDIIRRVELFLELEDLPKAWGLLLTDAPMFVQKVDMLSQCRCSDGVNDTCTPLPFVIGTDTLARLVDKKYYDGSQEVMLSSLKEMACKFIVGGRLEQKTENPSFTTGSEAVVELPEAIQRKFRLMGGFRVDISSSEIRAQSSSTK